MHPSPGWSDTEIDYSFIDQNPIEGTNYYRLIQIDFDGAKHHSDIIQFTIESSEKWNVQPSVIQSTLWIQGPDVEANLEIYDSFGVRISDPQTINGSSDVDFSQVPPGIYHIRLIDPSGQQVFSVSKI